MLEAVHSWLSVDPAERYLEFRLDLDLLDFNDLSIEEHQSALRILREVAKSTAAAMQTMQRQKRRGDEP